MAISGPRESSAFADPKLRVSLVLALGAMAAGGFLLVVGLLVRRYRWPAIAIGGAVIVYFVPSLKPLTKDAYPTTYFASPVLFTAQSIADGESLFATNCASCHGAEGRGDGPAGRFLATKPADLTADHVYGHSDGDLFWWISNGIDAVMPGFGRILDDDARWNVINFIRANADAVRLRALGAATQAAFPSPNFSAQAAFPSPNFSVTCSDGSTISVDQALGRIAHVVVAGTGTNDRLRQLALNHDVITIVIAIDWTAASDLPVCTTQDPNVVETFALYAGGDLQETNGAEFLIDRDGNLRSMWYSARTPGLSEFDMLTQLIQGLRFPPVVVRPTGTGAHSHVH